MYVQKIRSTIAIGMLSFVGLTAEAAVTVVSNTSSLSVYESYAAYAAATSRITTDSFDDLALGDLGPVLTRNLGDATYTVAAADGLWGTGGDDRYLSTAATGNALLFAGFGAEARGFGAYVFGGDDDGAPVRASSIDLIITDATGTLVVNVTNAAATDFIGFLGAATLQAAVVGSDSERYYPTLNDVSVALAPVPEPGTYAMLLVGLAVVPVMRWRRAR